MSTIKTSFKDICAVHRVQVWHINQVKLKTKGKKNLQVNKNKCYGV